MLETWLQSDQIQKGSVVLVSNQVCLAVLSSVFRERFTCECFSSEGFFWGGGGTSRIAFWEVGVEREKGES